MNITVICIMGPTASGKTDLSLRVASEFPCEIISVDSAMVYRGMDIGTAKPSMQTRQHIPHHLIDICEPSDPYSAAKFVHDTKQLIEDIHQRGNIPLLVGGTMLYYKALQKGISPLPSADPDTRMQLSLEAQRIGWQAMHERLSLIDPLAATRINANDPQRIQRALEVFYISGKPLSELWDSQEKISSPYQWLNIALAPSDRKVLHERIEVRFQEMLSSGFIEEVEQLRRNTDLHLELPSMRCVGYRQVWEYLDQVINYQEMLTQGMAATRQLAKRQLTWLRHWEDISWLDTLDNQVFDKLKALMPYT